ncbi:MAG: uridine kinase [Marinilabiliaceae bacterium]|nr:uridine kinase [Marinilabiliaceae bacterium]
MLIIGIAGGAGSGKTTVVNKVVDRIPVDTAAILSQDAYYCDGSHLPMKERQRMNFDHPDSVEFDLLVNHLCKLKAGETIYQPVYSYVSYTRQEETIEIKPKEVIIIEGILVLTHQALRSMMDLKIFVDAEADDRLIRVIHRDIKERGRDTNQILQRYQATVKPMHFQFIEPSKRYADLIVPQGGNNHVAIDILSRYILHNINDKTLENA